MERTLLPGSFNPFTEGYLDTMGRTVKLFDEAIISVFISTSKNNLFPPEGRMTLIAKAVAHLPNVKVIHQESRLAVETAKEVDADALVRGIQNIKDFKYERGIAQMNHHLNKELEMVLLLAKPEYSYVSSSILKEILHFGEDTSSYLPPIINEVLARKRESNES